MEALRDFYDIKIDSTWIMAVRGSLPNINDDSLLLKRALQQLSWNKTHCVFPKSLSFESQFHYPNFNEPPNLPIEPLLLPEISTLIMKFTSAKEMQLERANWLLKTNIEAKLQSMDANFDFICDLYLQAVRCIHDYRFDRVNQVR